MNESNQNNSMNNISFLFGEDENENTNRNTNRNMNKRKNKNNQRLNNNILYGYSNNGSWSQSFVDTPFSVKIGYILIALLGIYYTLFIQYHLFTSILLIAVVSLLFFFIHPIAGVIALILLLIIVYHQRSGHIKLKGQVFAETEIENNKAYDGRKDHFSVLSDKMSRELTPGVSTYSFWLYLRKAYDNEPIYRNNEWKSIFYRGSPLQQKDDIHQLVQYPGVWVKPDNQTLAIVFQKAGGQNESVELPDIEMNVWNHFTISCMNQSVSVYKNGKLEVSRNLLESPASMSDYGLYVTSDYASTSMEEESSQSSTNTGFDGNLAYLSYYEYTLSPEEIEKSMTLYEKKVHDFEKKRSKK